jgi:hypothetical protein
MWWQTGQSAEQAHKLGLGELAKFGEFMYFDRISQARLDMFSDAP